MPKEEEIRVIFEKKLVSKYYKGKINKSLIDAAIGLSQAEVINACDDCFKSAILYDRCFNEHDLITILNEKNIYSMGMEA